MKTRFHIAFFFILIVLWPALIFASDELYDAPGFDPNRETLSSIPNEHIDPFTGGLILSFEDIRLPGNGGLDLVVQRTFNSKNTCREWTLFLDRWSCTVPGENTWLGHGWTLHFGRLFKSTNLQGPHLVEMPDGSRHAAYLKTNSSLHVTKNYWLLNINANPPVLTLTNGTKITFGQSGPPYPNDTKHLIYYASRIVDVNGNQITISYKNSGSSEIDYVIDSVGRRIEFTTQVINGAGRLTSISGPDVSVSYAHKALAQAGSTLLVKASPPVGDPWRYRYDETTLELESLDTPYGGTISYSYDISEVSTGTISKFYRTVVEKTTGGRDVTGGTWTFSYSQGTAHNMTEIHDPCGRVIRYSYYGYGVTLPAESMWKYGLPKVKEIVGKETTTYNWVASAAISADDYTVPYVGRDSQIYVPLLSKKGISRGGQNYSTSFPDYDAHGNPKTISESGDKTRKRELTYWKDTTKNIVQGKPASETLKGDFPGTFTTKYTYDDANGNLLKKVRYGVATKYTYYSNGNLETSTDANENLVSYEWDNGRISRITNAFYSITREINPNGTVASETNGRGFETLFRYDDNLRLRRIIPPIGHPTIFTYPDDNSCKLETRGEYYTYHKVDGFGRPRGTEDIKGVRTHVGYKACDLTDHTSSNIGDVITYDAFGRVRKIVHKDELEINYRYTGSDVTVTDEAGKETFFNCHAFGDPDEKLLRGVKDALGNQTSYGYNILGSLTRITQPKLTRTYKYNTKNFLESENHPETGTKTYTRDNVGNLKTKTDDSGTTTYGYDALNRLRVIDYGSGTITYRYDDADNRILMETPHTTIEYTYDEVNRFRRKQQTILGNLYTTRYHYDDNDNLTGIDYPTGQTITYGYNRKNQVTEVLGQGWGIDTIRYHTTDTAIGLPREMTFSNGIVTTLNYTLRNFNHTLRADPLVLDLTYGYYASGNLKKIEDDLDPVRDQAFTYDKLNRLKTYSGSWGQGTFGYTATGNRKSKTLNGVLTAYTYSNNRLVSTTGGEEISYDYNADGDATFLMQGGLGYELRRNRLHQLTGYLTSGGDTIAQYGYDGDGQRILKTANGKTTLYHYGKGGELLSETDETGTPQADYFYLHGKLALKVAPDGVFFYHVDPAGTPLAMTDASGSVVWRADYKPFGEEQDIQEAVPNDRRFVGKEKDEESGLHYFGARYMESKIGRFLSADPVRAVDPSTGKVSTKILRNPQRLNLYAYGLNNPFRYIDPDGASVWDIADIGFFCYSTYNFAREPSWSNAVDLGLDAVGLLPIVPSVGAIKLVGKGLSKLDDSVDASRALKQGTKLVDGMKMSTSKALDTAEQFLGKGYKDMGKGRFISADGLRQVRMGDADILGKHSGGPHINLERFDSPVGPGSRPKENIHIFLTD